VLQVTNNKSYPESLVLSLALKGLNPEIKQIVMPQNHTTNEALRKASNLAEKTVVATDNTVRVAAAFSDIYH
jgi:hypothetical protein